MMASKSNLFTISPIVAEHKHKQELEPNSKTDMGDSPGMRVHWAYRDGLEAREMKRQGPDSKLRVLQIALWLCDFIVHIVRL
jgi:hypothetical protein